MKIWFLTFTEKRRSGNTRPHPQLGASGELSHGTEVPTTPTSLPDTVTHGYTPSPLPCVMLA